MKQWKMLILGTLALSSSLFASSRVCINHEKKEVTLAAHYFYYGKAVDAVTAQKCTDEINRLFNNSSMIQLNKSGDWLKFKAVVTHSIVPEEDAAKLVAINVSQKYNFIRMDNPSRGSRVVISEHGLNSNYGYFILKDNLGISTTCAHEFAHGLGLDHINPRDWRKKGVPPIMAPRGTLVDPQFQYNPNAKAGTKGGTLNPIHRTVHIKEIGLINMGDLDYEWVDHTTECANQGVVSRNMYRIDGTIYQSRKLLSIF